MPISYQCKWVLIYRPKLTLLQGKDIDYSKPFENEAIVQTIHEEFFNHYAKSVDKDYPHRFPGSRNTWKLDNTIIAFAATGVRLIIQMRCNTNEPETL